MIPLLQSRELTLPGGDLSRSFFGADIQELKMNRPPLPPFSAEAAAQKVRMGEEPPTPHRLLVYRLLEPPQRRSPIVPAGERGVGSAYVKPPMMADYVPTLYVRLASLAYGSLLPRH